MRWSLCRPKHRSDVGDLETYFPFFRWPDRSFDAFDNAWRPAVDIEETKDSFEIKADLPGLDKKDLAIHVDGDQLVIKGEKKVEKKSEDKDWSRQERAYGSFYRSFTLPRTVNSDQLKATYKNGVLSLSLPKKEEAQPKHIDVDIDD